MGAAVASSTRVLLPAVLLFVAAVVVARLLLTGGWGWVVFGLSAPILLAVLSARIGFLPALLVVVLYAAAILLVRLLLLQSALAVAVLLLVPVLALAGRLAWNVVRALREGPSGLGIQVEEGAEGEEEKG